MQRDDTTEAEDEDRGSDDPRWRLVSVVSAWRQDDHCDGLTPRGLWVTLKVM